MKAVNEKEFKALIKKYESITLEELKNNDTECTPWTVLEVLTGFGSWGTCTLCEPMRTAVSVDCSKCAYASTDEKFHCTKCDNRASYKDIENADSLESLLIAIKSRAEHMKKVWKSYLKIRTK